MKFNTYQLKYNNFVLNKESNNSKLDNNRSWISYVLMTGDNISKIKPLEISYKNKKHTHAGLIYYLYRCWAKEKGVNLRPDMIWYTIVSETTNEILNNIEKYKHLFSKSSIKKDLIILTEDDTNIDNDILDDLLDRIVINKDFKKLITTINFKSQPEEFIIALKMSFTYMCKSYFNYMSSLCGIPHVEVEGELEEWIILIDSIMKLTEYVPELSEYYKRCVKTLNDLCYFSFNHDKLSPLLNKLKLVNNSWIYNVKETTNKYLNKEDFFTHIFIIKGNCSSNHPYTFAGWISNFYKKHNLTTLYDYPTHLRYIPYKNIETKKMFYKAIGLTYSDEFDGTLYPKYGHVKHEILDDILFDKLRN